MKKKKVDEDMNTQRKIIFIQVNYNYTLNLDSSTFTQCYFLLALDYMFYLYRSYHCYEKLAYARSEARQGFLALNNQGEANMTEAIKKREHLC